MSNGRTHFNRLILIVMPFYLDSWDDDDEAEDPEEEDTDDDADDDDDAFSELDM